MVVGICVKVGNVGVERPVVSTLFFIYYFDVYLNLLTCFSGQWPEPQ